MFSWLVTLSGSPLADSSQLPDPVGSSPYVAGNQSLELVGAFCRPPSTAVCNGLYVISRGVLANHSWLVVAQWLDTVVEQSRDPLESGKKCSTLDEDAQETRLYCRFLSYHIVRLFFAGWLQQGIAMSFEEGFFHSKQPSMISSIISDLGAEGRRCH